MINKRMKNAQHHMLLGNSKLNNEIPLLHTYYNGYIPKDWQYQILLKLQTSKSFHELLVRR